MGKVLVILLFCLAFVFQGCEAFKNKYDPAPSEGGNIAPGELPGVSGTPAGGNATPSEGNAPPSEGGGENNNVIDYSVDTTACENNVGIFVTVVKDKTDLLNDGWTTEVEGDQEYSVLAEKKGEYTTAISISKGSDKLSFTVKQTAADMFNVCDVTYKGCSSGNCVGVSSVWSDVESGTIDIYKFNDSSTNAGGYNITFGKSTQGDPAETLEGSYFTDKMGEPFAE